MSVDKKSRRKFIQKIIKNIKSGMRKIISVSQSFGRGMGHQKIKTFPPFYFQPEFQDAQFHLILGILELAGAVTHGASKPQNPKSLVFIKLIIDADAAFRRCMKIAFIVIAVYI